MSRREFIDTGRHLLPVDSIHAVDLRSLAETGTISLVVVNVGGSAVHVLRGAYAITALQRLHPAALEGRARRGLRAWTLHNLLGHPLMELLARVGLPRWGLWVHDHTVPGADSKTVGSTV